MGVSLSGTWWVQAPAACSALPFPSALPRAPSAVPILVLLTDVLFGSRRKVWEPRPLVRSSLHPSTDTSCVTLAESLSVSEFQFPHLRNGHHVWMHLRGLWGLRGEGVWCIHRAWLLVVTVIITCQSALRTLLSVFRAHYLVPKHCPPGDGPLGPALLQSRQGTKA